MTRRVSGGGVERVVSTRVKADSRVDDHKDRTSESFLPVASARLHHRRLRVCAAVNPRASRRVTTVRSQALLAASQLPGGGPMVAVAAMCTLLIPEWSHDRNAKFRTHPVDHIVGHGAYPAPDTRMTEVCSGSAGGQPTSSPAVPAATSSSRAPATRERTVPTRQPMTLAASAYDMPST